MLRAKSYIKIISVYIEWYKYGYYTWFFIGLIVMIHSWIIQWLYSTWNLNDYLQNILKRQHQKYITKAKFFAICLRKSIISPNSSLYVTIRKHENQLELVNKAKSTDIMKSKLYIFHQDDINDINDNTDDEYTIDTSAGDSSSIIENIKRVPLIIECQKS